jgi:hypothetical protein
MNRLSKFIRHAIGQKYATPNSHEIRVGKWLRFVGYNKEEIRYQPNGSTQPPDWLVFDRRKWIRVECKTSKTARPSFFDSYPDANTLYVYTDLKYNDTTLFYGCHIFSKKLVDLYEKIHYNVIKDLELKNKKIFLESPHNPFGFRPGFRPCWKQCGNKEKTDFFQEDIRKMLENKAKKRASGK